MLKKEDIVMEAIFELGDDDRYRYYIPFGVNHYIGNINSYSRKANAKRAAKDFVNSMGLNFNEYKD